MAEKEEDIKTLPHNLEAEQTLLGAILLDNQVLIKVGDKFAPEHFYDPVHGKIFETIRNLNAKGHIADGVTLHARFSQDGTLSDIGGATYLALLVNAAADPAAAQDYAKLIFDLALRRDLIRIGAEIGYEAKIVNDDIYSAEKIIEESEEKLYKLAETGATSTGFIPFSESLATTIDNAFKALNRDTQLVGVTTGFSDLDRWLGGLHPSDLLILAGRPSMGKTSLATNIAFNAARKYRFETDDFGNRVRKDGGVVAFYSLEMSAEQLTLRILADWTGIGSDKIRKGEMSKAEFKHLEEATREIGQLPLYIDDTGGLSIAALAARARRLQRRHDLHLIVVDYLQLVTATGGKAGENRVQEVSAITQGLKALAKELNVPIIALSQLSRQVENRDDKRPQLADLRESGSIEQDADVVMFVFRESYYLLRTEPEPGTDKHFEWQEKVAACENTAEVIIAKQRHGAIGKIKLGFQAELTKFTNLDHNGGLISLEE
ncbi:MAG: replicative DNA helicase [Caulobacterales bacterium]|nr:replicative DNA helicase [Caulobacterales bacterium]